MSGVSSSKRFLRFLGPVQIVRVIGDPQERRRFCVVAYDGSCNYEIVIREPWVTDEQIGERLAYCGLEVLISAASRHVLSGASF